MNFMEWERNGIYGMKFRNGCESANWNETLAGLSPKCVCASTHTHTYTDSVAIIIQFNV